MSLPPLSDSLQSSSQLQHALSVLFEPSPSLERQLVPSISSHVQKTPPTSYSELVDLCEQEVAHWKQDEQADFVGGHPRIGEVKNLSALSSREQAGSSNATPPEVLARLETLNSLYEARYPKLRYITFVNGRSRAQVADDLERFLMQPTGEKDSEGASAAPTETQEVGSKPWRAELERALADVFRIAKARLRGMGVE